MNQELRLGLKSRMRRKWRMERKPRPGRESSLNRRNKSH